MATSKMESRERAELFRNFLEPVSRDFSSLDGLALSGVVEVTETAQDAFDDLWRQGEFQPYPENRMKHLMEVTGQRVIDLHLFPCPLLFSNHAHLIHLP